MENVNDLKGLKEEIKVYEREILGMLLEVSQSFSDEKYPKEKREELFSKIDNLRDKVKDIAKIIEEVENRKYDFAYENIEINENRFKLEKLEELEKEEIKEDDVNEEEKIVEESLEENDDEIIEEDLSNIDEAIENMEKRETMIEEKEESDIKEKQEEKKKNKNKNKNTNEDIEVNVNKSDIQELTFEDAFGKIDKLIQEAKEINNNVIKFPEDKVVRRNGFRDYEEEKEKNDYISYEDAVARRRERQNLEKKEEKKDIFEEISAKNIENSENIEPVPVLFGNNRAQNQMVVRKKSNGFTDKIKSLIFKIKTMLGGENEKEK